MARIAPTPRNKFLGQIADAILAADGYAEKPDPVMPMGKANPALALASRFLGVGALGRTADRLSYGEPVTNFGKANVPLIPPETAEAAMAAVPALQGAGKLARGAGKVSAALADALAAAPVGRSAQRGAIRVGGDPSLMPSHSTSTESLAQTINNGVPELYSPSIGIKKNDLMSGFESGGTDVRLIPRVGAYDPQNSTSSLFNRDVYTPRWESYSGSITKDVAERMQRMGGTTAQAAGWAKTRLKERFVPPADEKMLKGGEGSTYTSGDTLERVLAALGDGDNSMPQAVAITDSPAFRSFAQFEKSPKGADLLVDTSAGGKPNYGNIAADAQNKAFRGMEWQSPAERHDIMRQATEYGPTPSLLPEQLQAGRALRDAYRKLPSEYAELKVHGPTPVTQENWAGAVVGPMRDMSEADEKVLQALIQSGVSPVTPHDSLRRLPYDHPLYPWNDAGLGVQNRFDLADELQRQAGPARKQPLTPR